MKRILCFLTPLILLSLLAWYSLRTDPLRSPPALSRSAFDRSIGIDCLGSTSSSTRPRQKHTKKSPGAHLSEKKRVCLAARAVHSLHYPPGVDVTRASARPVSAASRLLKLQHPDCTYILWGPNEYEPILEELIGPLYSVLPLSVQRDMAAAAILWRQGGLAVDLQAECVQPATPLLPLGDCLLGFDPPRAKAKHGRRLLLSPSVIAATPCHPLIMAYLAEMIRRVKENGEVESSGSRKMLSQPPPRSFHRQAGFCSSVQPIFAPSTKTTSNASGKSLRGRRSGP